MSKTPSSADVLTGGVAKKDRGKGKAVIAALVVLLGWMLLTGGTEDEAEAADASEGMAQTGSLDCANPTAQAVLGACQGQLEVGGSCPGVAPDAVPRTLGGTMPTIFDSDFGSFMDDSFALAFAIGSPELTIELAIAHSGPGTNPERRARCLGRHLNDAGRGHIPLATGPSHTFDPNQSWWGDHPGDIGELESWGAGYNLADHPVRFVRLIFDRSRLIFDRFSTDVRLILTAIDRAASTATPPPPQRQSFCAILIYSDLF